MLHRYLWFGSKSNNRLGFKKVSRMVPVFNEKVQLILPSEFRSFLMTVHVIFFYLFYFLFFIFYFFGIF
jgi:hypothetical protein